jgi:hypothetical protein
VCSGLADDPARRLQTARSLIALTRVAERGWRAQVSDGYHPHYDVSRDRGDHPSPEPVPGAKARPAAAGDPLDPVVAVGYRFGDFLLASLLNGMILFCVMTVSIYVTAHTLRPWWAGFNKVKGEWQ